MCTKRYLSQHDLAVLNRFARSSGAAAGGLAPLLASTMPLPETAPPGRRVSLGATVRYRARGTGETGAIVIACPYQADAMLARVSILAPLALGLLGHQEGCTVGIDLPLARSLEVDIVEVTPPSRTPMEGN